MRGFQKMAAVIAASLLVVSCNPVAAAENGINVTYTATGTDESAYEISGTDTAVLENAVITKESGDASIADDSSFKGVNAAVRAYGRAVLTLRGCSVESHAKNATGVFSYDQATIYISDSAVTVTGGGSGGIQVAGGGTLHASNLTVTSAGKAAIRSDRGGGVLTVDGGTYTSTGSNGCPAIYSTADITVRNATCISTNSRAVIIEGKNSVTLENCIVEGNDQSTKSGSIRANVLLYQSASGDAKEGTSVFSMTGGSLKSSSGAMFYCTNTSSVVNLQGVVLELSEDGDLLIVSAGRWGKDGANGGKCTLNAVEQILEGDIEVDAISSLSMNMESSTFTGSVSGAGEVSVCLDSTSLWTLTADSSVSSIEYSEGCLDLNGHTLYVNGEELVL